MADEPGGVEPDGADTDVRLPRRPRDRSELSFSPKPAVRWFSPRVLGDAALRVAVSAAFGSYLDKRELQAVVGAGPLEHRVGAEEVWIDFVADTGDSFDSTYTMAWLSAQPELEVDGVESSLPRGSLLVLGGDEVYPTASAGAYRDRLSQPFRAALPWVEPGSSPHGQEMVVALPGNHDWYDGLTSFVRLFCQQRWFGGRRTIQSRSYFAVALPHGWWVWGIDIQLGADLDEPQIAYFRRVLEERMRSGDRIILCTGKPSWVDLPADPRAYDNLAFVEHLLATSGREVEVVVTLTGDSHHYARYEAQDRHRQVARQLITAGGGGAFLHPTHDLPEELTLPGGRSDPDPGPTLRLKECYPDRATSRRRALGALGLPFRNPSFMLVTAVAYSLLTWTSQLGIEAVLTSDGQPLDEAARSLGLLDLLSGTVRNLGAWMVATPFLGFLIAFAKPPPRLGPGRPATVVRVAMGTVHAAMHLLASLGLTLLAIRLVGSFADGWWFRVWLAVAVFAAGGLVGGLVMGVYLTLANRAGRWATHGNEAFSAQRCQDLKCFLRLHIAADGSLRIYPLAVPRVNRRWAYDPDNADPQASWMKPAGPTPEVRLIRSQGCDGPLVVSIPDGCSRDGDGSG